MTLSALRSAAKSSPVEHELVCPPKGHQVELLGGGLLCFGEGCAQPPFDADEGNVVPRPYAMADLVRFGRTRIRQFTTYPTPERFR